MPDVLVLTMPLPRFAEVAEMVGAIYDPNLRGSQKEPPPQRVIFANLLDHMACEGLLHDLAAIMSNVRRLEDIAALVNEVVGAMERAAGILRGRLEALALFVSPPGFMYWPRSLQQFVYILLEVCKARRVEFAICAPNLRPLSSPPRKRTAAKSWYSWTLILNVLLKHLTTTSPSLHIKLNNYFQKHLTYPCLRASNIGWIPVCAQSYVLEVPACTTSNLTTQLRALTTSCPKSCYRYFLIPLMPIAGSPNPNSLQTSQYHLPQLFSDHERARSPSPRISSPERQPSLLGTSAPLLTNPSLTSFLDNYPIWPAAPSLPLKSATEDDDAQSNVPTLPTTLPGAGTAPSFKRGRGRPPKTRQRLVRAKARTRKKETTTTLLSETAIPTEASEVPRYQLRSRRQPRYKCGTCGLRDCVCLLAVNENRRVPTGARGVPPERVEKVVHRLTVRAEKTYSSLERHGDHPVDTILEKLSLPGVAKAHVLASRSGLAMEKG